MSKLVEDVKSGLKGVKGGGDALRGELLDATDQAFDNHGGPSVGASRSKNRAIAEKGKADIRQMDENIAAHEWDRKRRNESAAVPNHGGTMSYDAAPSNDSRPETAEQPSNRVVSGGQGYAG